MRIGIITLPLQANYGGILQAYALQTALPCFNFRYDNRVTIVAADLKEVDLGEWLE